MPADDTTTYCGTCAAPVADDMRLPVDQRTPCPHCGGRSRTVKRELSTSVEPYTLLKGKQQRDGFRSGGKKKPVREFNSGSVQQADGTRRLVERSIDRECDRYRERVVAPDGTVTHEADEPLSQHQGHGSAKFNPKP